MIGPGSDKNKVLVCRPPLLLTTRAVQCEPLCFQELARSLPIMYHHHHHHFYHIRHRHRHRHRHIHRHRHQVPSKQRLWEGSVNLSSRARGGRGGFSHQVKTISS